MSQCSNITSEDDQLCLVAAHPFPPRSFPSREDDCPPRPPISRAAFSTRRDRFGGRTKFHRKELVDVPWIPFSCACKSVRYLKREESDDSDMSDSSSESDSDNDTEAEADQRQSFHGSASRGRQSTLVDQNYLRFRPGVVSSTYKGFCRWKASVRYALPPGHRQSSHKRTREADQKPRIAYIHDEDPADPDIIIISRIDGYYHLACPFYRHDPDSYYQCMHKHDFQSIEQVIIHIRLYHQMPIHCPICRSTFTDARVRDLHVRERTCEFRPELKIDGIDSQQMSKILRRDDPFVREDIRWLRMYYRIFPGSPLGCSPYLTEGAGFEVSLLRDYLSEDGPRCMLEYLRSCGLSKGEEDEKALAVLQRITLEDLVQSVLRDYGAGRTGGKIFGD